MGATPRPRGPRGPSLRGAVSRRQPASPRAGVRMTGPRREILALIPRLGDSFDAIEIQAHAPHLAKATVYRTLRLLTEEAILCRIVRSDGITAYRLAPPGFHHHLRCEECGAMEDVDARAIEPLLHRLAELTGYVLTAHRLEVYGRCPECPITTEDASPPTSSTGRR